MLQLLTKQLQMIFPEGIKGIIFDCDGVIIDSNDVNLLYYNMVLKELGYPEIAEEDRNYIQMISEQEAIDFLVPKKDHERLPEIFNRIPYEEKALPLFKLEPGLLELFQWLKSKDIYIGIHTNRGSSDLEAVLTYLNITEFFHTVMHVDLVPAKPHPGGTLKILDSWKVDHSKVAFVGDSLTDEGATRASGVPLISYRNKDLTAAIFIESFVDLHQALCKAYV